MIYRFTKMYDVVSNDRYAVVHAIPNGDAPPDCIIDADEIFKRFYDGEMRLDPDKTITDKEIHTFLLANNFAMTKAKVLSASDGESPQTWAGGLPGGDLDFLQNNTSVLHRFDNSLNKGIVYGLTVNRYAHCCTRILHHKPILPLLLLSIVYLPRRDDTTAAGSSGGVDGMMTATTTTTTTTTFDTSNVLAWLQSPTANGSALLCSPTGSCSYYYYYGGGGGGYFGKYPTKMLYICLLIRVKYIHYKVPILIN
jgi:hypothetical protein